MGHPIVYAKLVENKLILKFSYRIFYGGEIPETSRVPNNFFGCIAYRGDV
jgi:hypothetical protein